MPSFPEFELLPRDTVGLRFEKWTKRLDLLFTAIDITDAKRKKAILLHYGGEELSDIFETLTIQGDSDDYQKTVKTLKDHFTPRDCIDQHVYNFHKEVQRPNENISAFHTRLQLIAKQCRFANANDEIRRQLIHGCRSSRLCRKPLENALSLDALLKAASAMELAEEQAAEYEQAAHFVQSKRNSAKTQYKYRKKPNQQHQQAHHQKKHQQCGLCGGRYPHSLECPAKGKRCASCGKLNHFPRVCRSSQCDQSASDNNHQKGKEKSKRAFTVNENPNPESSGEDHDEHTDEDGYVFTMSESYRKSPNLTLSCVVLKSEL